MQTIKRRIRFNSYIQCENQTNFTSLINEDSIKNAKFNKIDWNCRDFHQEIFDSCKNQIESDNKITQKRFSCESLPKIDRIKRIKIGESPFKKQKIMRKLSYKKDKDKESIQKIIKDNYFSFGFPKAKNSITPKPKLSFLFQFQSPIMQINKSSAINTILTNQNYLQSIYTSNISKLDSIKNSKHSIINSITKIN